MNCNIKSSVFETMLEEFILGFFNAIVLSGVDIQNKALREAELLGYIVNSEGDFDSIYLEYDSVTWTLPLDNTHGNALKINIQTFLSC